MANYLHGDISRNNLMFYRQGDDVIGVLCDWDAAHVRDRVDEAIYELDPPEDTFQKVDNWWIYDYKGKRYTGTPAYMDIERQTGMAPHRYEHDLESFFWVLLDFLKHFDPEDELFQGDPLTGSWDHEDRAVWKVQFLLDNTTFSCMRTYVHEDYQGVFDDWVPKLRAIFCRSFRIRTAHPSETTLRQLLEAATAANDGEAQYDICKKLEAKIQERKVVVSYQTVMHALGAALDV